MTWSKIIVTFLASTICASLFADEIVVNKIKFRGDSKQIAEYNEAVKVLKNKDNHFADMREGYANKTATIEEYSKAQREYVAARNRMLSLELNLELIPTIAFSEPAKMKPEMIQSIDKAMMRQLFNEGRKITDRLQLIKQKKLTQDEYETRLKIFLSKCRYHPAEAPILIALGKLNENSYDIAVSYFSKATQCLFPSDNWNFAKQDAWKQLARLHEKNKAYEKAIEALKQWKISEPCGTGAGASRIKKKFWIWRLLAHTKGIEKVRKEMWEEIVEAKIPCNVVGEKRLAEWILSLYEGKDDSEFSKDIERAIMKVTDSIPNDEYAKSRKVDILKFLNILKENKSEQD